jgi:co-chaperonin GroES (HSP10)
MSTEVRPTGYRILIQPIKVEDFTPGGLALPEEVKTAKSYLRYVGRVIALGPNAYQHPKFQGAPPWCKEGDWVIYCQNNGQPVVLKVDGTEEAYRLINDDEVLAVVDNPDAVLIYL